jgi:hypothetical protein
VSQLRRRKRGTVMDEYAGSMSAIECIRVALLFVFGLALAGFIAECNDALHPKGQGTPTATSLNGRGGSAR